MHRKRIAAVPLVERAANIKKIAVYLLRQGVIFLGLLLCAANFFSCKKTSLPARTEFALGTVCSVQLFEYGTQKRYEALFAALQDIEQSFSAKIPSSQVGLINEAAGKCAVHVSDEVIFVLQKALFYADLSGGVYDPTIGALTSLWNIGSDDERVPSCDEIAAALLLIDYKKIDIDGGSRTVFLRQAGMKLDLGSIVKGYAADVLAGIIRREGIKRALIDLGGTIYAVGFKQPGVPWQIGIKNPLSRGEGAAVLFPGHDLSVVTSGIYERYFEADGRRYHHILDCKTGYPVENGVASFTILSSSAVDGDVLSTVCFLLGAEKGTALLDRLDGAEGICIMQDAGMYVTSRIDTADLRIADRITLRAGFNQGNTD